MREMSQLPAIYAVLYLRYPSDILSSTVNSEMSFPRLETLQSNIVHPIAAVTSMPASEFKNTILQPLPGTITPLLHRYSDLPSRHLDATFRPRMTRRLVPDLNNSMSKLQRARVHMQ